MEVILFFKVQYVVWNVANKQASKQTTDRCTPKVCNFSIKWSCPTATSQRQERGI